MIACDQVKIGRWIVYLAGDTLTYRQLADLVEAKVGGHWTRELWDQEFLRKKLEVSNWCLLTSLRIFFPDMRRICLAAWLLRYATKEKGESFTDAYFMISGRPGQQHGQVPERLCPGRRRLLGRDQDS